MRFSPHTVTYTGAAVALVLEAFGIYGLVKLAGLAWTIHRIGAPDKVVSGDAAPNGNLDSLETVGR